MRLKISCLFTALALSIALPSTSFAEDPEDFCGPTRCETGGKCVSAGQAIGYTYQYCVLKSDSTKTCTAPGLYSTNQICCSTGQPPNNGKYAQCK